MATSTSHIRKRPFQPSITSYFNNRDVDPNTAFQLQRSRSPLSPPLPEETQASLLSVGMRVRKSVPEGYKTHKTLGIDGFPFPSSAPVTASTPIQRSYSGVSTRELTPFCGLHKTGGWAAQEVPSSSAPAAMVQHEAEDDVPGMSFSESSLPSARSSFMSSASAQATATRKRTYEEEVEDDMDAYFDEMEAAETAEQNVMSINRPMARMKPTLRKAATDGMVRIVGENDFEEAAFLAPLDGMDLDDA